MFFGLTFSSLLARLIVLATAFTVHEFAHAWTADRFGDDTPRVNGRLSLNPLVHLDPMGSLLLLVAGFGWAKPVPVNPYALGRRSPSALMWVSLAGPLSNFLMAVIAAIPFRLELISYQRAVSDAYTAGQHLLPTLPQFLYEFITINLVLMLFNLIPLAPLDGDKIAAYFVPPAWADTLDRIRPYGPLLLLALFMAGPLLGINLIGWIISPAMNFLFDLLVR